MTLHRGSTICWSASKWPKVPEYLRQSQSRNHCRCARHGDDGFRRLTITRAASEKIPAGRQDQVCVATSCRAAFVASHKSKRSSILVQQNQKRRNVMQRLIGCLSIFGVLFVTPAAAEQNVSRLLRPLIFVQAGDCGCQFQYDNCRGPCRNYQGAAAQRGCIDICLRQLRSCRQSCRR